MFMFGLKLWSINTDVYLEEAKKLYKKNIFDYIELYVVPETLYALDSWKKLRIPFVIHNAHFAHGFNLAKKDKEQRNREIFRQTLMFANELNAPYIVMHGGIDGEVEETIRQMRDFHDKRILIENKPFIALPNRMGGNFCRGSTVEEVLKIIREVGCGFCLDIGHAICSANSHGFEPYAYVKKMRRLRPCMFHISDVEDMRSIYDSHPHLGTGKLDFAWLKNEIFFKDAMITVETVKSFTDNLSDFVEDIRYLKNV